MTEPPATGTIEMGAGVLNVRRAELVATVTRANGTVEHLGVIAVSDATPPTLLQRIGKKLCRTT